jgi:hypothetical protein
MKKNNPLLEMILFYKLLLELKRHHPDKEKLADFKEIIECEIGVIFNKELTDADNFELKFIKEYMEDFYKTIDLFDNLYKKSK